MKEVIHITPSDATLTGNDGGWLEKCLVSKYTITIQEGYNMKKCALLRISIGLQLMCLITFPFYCVKEEVMKMVETHRYD